MVGGRIEDWRVKAKMLIRICVRCCRRKIHSRDCSTWWRGCSLTPKQSSRRCLYMKIDPGSRERKKQQGNVSIARADVLRTHFLRKTMSPSEWRKLSFRTNLSYGALLLCAGWPGQMQMRAYRFMTISRQQIRFRKKCPRFTFRKCWRSSFGTFLHAWVRR